jgi:hypothetical protein
MLKFTTTTPFDENTSIDKLMSIQPLIMLKEKRHLIESPIIGKEARIVGSALDLAGFHLPCFFEGDFSELDKKEPNVIMVLPSGEYPIRVNLDKDGVYNLDV